MKKFFHLLPFLFVLNSCGLIIVNGFSDDYNNLKEQHKAMIVSFKPNQPVDKNRIFVINPVELRTEIKRYPKALVYTFASGCSSEFCKPLYVYENWAQKNNYKLFLVMVSYANLDYTLQEIYDSQLYVIDSHYFKESRFRSYVSYFENELQGLDRYAKDKTIGNLFFFENGVFVKNLRELPRE